MVDSTNITLEWPRPEGRIESYIVKWRPEGDGPELEKNLTEQSLRGPANGVKPPTVNMFITDLMPGLKYHFEIVTVSYNYQSDPTKIEKRTSKC